MANIIKHGVWGSFYTCFIFFYRFVAVEDVLLVLVFLYSLTGGQDCFDSPMEEEQIKVCTTSYLTC